MAVGKQKRDRERKDKGYQRVASAFCSIDVTNHLVYLVLGKLKPFAVSAIVAIFFVQGFLNFHNVGIPGTGNHF